MDCIDLFKRAAVALQTDSRYLVLDQTRKANDKDEELQNMIGEFNLARMDLNNEIGKSERNDARIAELNEKVNSLYGHEWRRPHDGTGAFCILHRQLLHLRRLPLKPAKTKRGCAKQTAFCLPQRLQAANYAQNGRGK